MTTDKYKNISLQSGDYVYCDPLGFGLVLECFQDKPSGHDKKLLTKLGKNDTKVINRAKIHWYGGSEFPSSVVSHCVEVMKWGTEGLRIVRRRKD